MPRWLQAGSLAPIACVTLSICVAALAVTDDVRAQSSKVEKFESFSWKDTARLEHEDRKNRFRRLAAAGLIASPKFYEELVSRKELLAFGIDIPILRLAFQPQAFFDTDKSELRAEALKQLDVVAESLRKDVPDLAVFVAGHADSRGDDDYNYILSVARADTVARYLFSRGIGVAKLWRVGFGEAIPLKPNTTAENMAANRRVEFLFAARPEAIAVWLSKQKDIICEGTSASVKEKCGVDKIEMLPPIVATPVISEKPTAIVPLEARTSTSVVAMRSTVITSAETTGAMAGAKQQTVEIEKNSLVIIDLKEQRVSVGAPVL